MKSAMDELTAAAAKVSRTNQLAFMSGQAAREIVDTFLAKLVEQAKVGPVQTPIGTFRWVTRKPRRILNFQGQWVQLPATKQLHFTANRHFRGIR